MTIRNVVFDVGGVLLTWNPPSVIARLYPDAATQAVIRQQMFEHADWHEFDRGALSYEVAIQHFAKQTGRSPDETRALIHATRVAVTGRTQSPGLFEVLAWLGRERVRTRLTQLLEFLAARVS